jgi:hypothetical protein
MKRRLYTLIIVCCLALLTARLGAEVLQEIVVKEGDTLWGVANYYLKDPRRWPEILKYNRLPSSDLNVILPGMTLKVPILLIKEHLRTAYLIYLLNDVRFRRHSEAEWKKAWKDMELYNEDGLRTLGQSKARVRFPSGEMLQLDENSLIILKPEKKREEIDLLAGAVRASRTKVLSNGSLVDPKIEPRGPNPDFKTKIKEDRTTLVEVYEGIVDVTAQGRTVTLTKGFGTEVKFRQAPSIPTALPPRPDISLEAPTQMPGTDFTTSGKITSSSLRIGVKAPAVAAQQAAETKEKGAAQPQAQVLGQLVNKYRLQVATATAFLSPVIDETKPIKEKTDIDFKKSGLPDGIYYYRIAYLDDLGFEGQFSNPVQFVIDTLPPLLEIYAPQNEEEVDTEFVHIEGRTDPGITLKAADKPVVIEDDGKFLTAYMPRNGRNTVTMTAEDKAGNRTTKEITFVKVKKSTTVKKQTPQLAGKIKGKGSSVMSAALGTLTAGVIVGVLILLLN